MSKADSFTLVKRIKEWASQLGFELVGITDLDLGQYKKRFLSWLEENYHGDMAYLSRNLEKRFDASKLVPNAKRAICVGINYYNENSGPISRYAVGKDYHKIIRRKLEKLAEKIATVTGEFNYRAFTDSAPILEKPLAEKAGLGWIGKNGVLINPQLGSMFFLGELIVDLELPIDKPSERECGDCKACMEACPTKAIIEPGLIDANRCISYLTIEHKGEIPTKLAEKFSGQIYGCDICQLVCPRNKYARPTAEPKFQPQEAIKNKSLADFASWSEEDFNKNTLGTVIRKIGYKLWKRNLEKPLA